MIISDLEFSVVQAPRNDGGPPIRSLLVCLITACGRLGWGEAPLSWRVDELAERRKNLLPILAARNVFDIEEMLALKALSEPALACALEMAAWDIIAKSARTPLSQLFGGGYRQRVPLIVRIPSLESSQVQQVARELGEHGFHSLLISASGNFNDDLRLVEEVKEAGGEQSVLHLDGGGRYELPDARELCLRLGKEKIALFIDPISGEDLENSASLARQINNPLGVSAAIHNSKDVMAVVRSGAATHVTVDLFRVGGVSAARKCAAVAEAGGLSVSLAAERSLGVAAAAMLQTAAATPIFAYGNYSDYPQLQDDILSASLEMSDGMASVPQISGIGIEVDREKLERFQVT